MLLIRTLLLFLSLLISSSLLAGPLDAVVKLTSHGGSGTVIWTGPNETYILSAHHMFEKKASRGQRQSDFDRPVQIDAPDPRPGPAKPGPARCIAIDAAADLALVKVQSGPFPYFARVAPAGHQPGRLISCGFDRLQWNSTGPCRATARPAHIIGQDTRQVEYGYTHATWEPDYYCDRTSGANFTLTQELPWHGRSGGGLIDVDSGVLVGVVSGYRGTHPKTWAEVKPGACGIYGSHQAILRFLTQHAPQTLQPPAAQPQQYLPQLEMQLQQINQQQQQINQMIQQQNLPQAPGRPFIQEWYESPGGIRRPVSPPLQVAPIAYAPPQQIPLTPLTSPQQQYMQPQQRGLPCPPGGT